MPVTAELERERDYLIRARAELARMRERTLSLEAHGGNPVSSEALAATLHRRAQSLVDDPTANLFFGRIDQQRSDAPAPERWYIGRRHVADSHGDPVVIDFAARRLPSMAPGLGVPVSVRDNPGRLEIVRVDRVTL